MGPAPKCHKNCPKCHKNEIFDEEKIDKCGHVFFRQFILDIETHEIIWIREAPIFHTILKII